MASKEQAVRDAALALQTAIADATVEGLRVNWPTNPAGLSRMEISEAAKVSAPTPAGEEYDKLSKPTLLELASARNLNPHANSTKAELAVLLRSGKPVSSAPATV
jgi:hypothetical protein